MNLPEFPGCVVDLECTCKDFLGQVNVHGLVAKVHAPGMFRDECIIERTIKNLGNVDYLKKKMKDKDDDNALIYNLDKYLSQKPKNELNPAHIFMWRIARQAINGYEVSVKGHPIAQKYNIEKHQDFIAFIIKYIDRLEDEKDEIRKDLEQLEEELKAYLDLEEKILSLISHGNYEINVVKDYFYISITSYDSTVGPSEDTL